MSNLFNFIVDINECFEDTGVCGIHNCQNNNGRYQCLCTTGYLTNDNGECAPGNS